MTDTTVECVRCNQMWTPAAHTYNFHNLCHLCFLAFDAQKMIGRFYPLITPDASPPYPEYYEDSREWVRANSVTKAPIVMKKYGDQ